MICVSYIINGTYTIGDQHGYPHQPSSQSTADPANPRRHPHPMPRPHWVDPPHGDRPPQRTTAVVRVPSLVWLPKGWTMKPAMNNGSVQPHDNGLAHGDCRCPLCGSLISPSRLASMIGAQKLRDSEIEEAVAARFTSQIAKVEAGKRTEIEKARREAAKVAETKLGAMRANQDAVIAARLETQRQNFEKATSGAVLAERAKYLGEKLKL